MINGRVLTANNLSNAAGIRHGFFTREGGVSNGIYASLNVGLGSDDDRENVLENRRRVAAHLGANLNGNPLNDITTNYQVHSAKAVIITAQNATQRREADALVTNTPGIAIGALTADCTPVLFADPIAKVVGAAHAGWRGATTGILEATLSAMRELGSQNENIIAAIGPTISQINYEVGPEFEAQLIEDEPGNAVHFTIPDGKTRAHFNLPEYCRNRLTRASIGQIEDLATCTYQNASLFFSYRRKTHKLEPDYGRQVSAILIT